MPLLKQTKAGPFSQLSFWCCLHCWVSELKALLLSNTEQHLNLHRSEGLSFRDLRGRKVICAFIYQWILLSLFFKELLINSYFAQALCWYWMWSNIPPCWSVDGMLLIVWEHHHHWFAVYFLDIPFAVSFHLACLLKGCIICNIIQGPLLTTVPWHLLMEFVSCPVWQIQAIWSPRTRDIDLAKGG